MKKTLIAIIIGLNEIISLYGESWLFKTEKEAKDAFPNEEILCSTIVDPSYDQTFKLVLSTDENKVRCLMSFLNSIYYPRASNNDLMIRKIEALDRENTNLGRSNGAGIKICDIACKCTAYSIGPEDSQKRSIDEVRESFNVEMQRAREDDFIIRLVEYGETLGHRHKMPVKGLGLLNYPVRASHQDESKCYALCEIIPETNSPKRLTGNENLLEANMIDLRKFAPNAPNKEEIYVNGEKLGIIGVTWLKLLGIKQWNTSIEKKSIKYNIFYPKSIDANIKKAIDTLSTIKQEILDEIEREQTLNKNVINSARAEGAEIQIIKSAKKMLQDGMELKSVVEYSGLNKEIFEKNIEELNLTPTQKCELVDYFKQLKNS